MSLLTFVVLWHGANVCSTNKVFFCEVWSSNTCLKREGLIAPILFSNSFFFLIVLQANEKRMTLKNRNWKDLEMWCLFTWWHVAECELQVYLTYNFEVLVLFLSIFIFAIFWRQISHYTYSRTLVSSYFADRMLHQRNVITFWITFILSAIGFLSLLPHRFAVVWSDLVFHYPPGRCSRQLPAWMNEKAAVQNIVHKCQGRIHRIQSRCFEHRELFKVVSQKEAVEIRPALCLGISFQCTDTVDCPWQRAFFSRVLSKTQEVSLSCPCTHVFVTTLISVYSLWKDDILTDTEPAVPRG